tara:strand:+ start:252 stop:668 length:417 start_codon:yes stop_codon:yes gene_type:complete
MIFFIRLCWILFFPVICLSNDLLINNIEYQYINESDLGDKYLINVKSIKSKENFRSALILINYNLDSPPKFNNQDILSSLELEEFNCNDNSHTNFSRQFYSKLDLGGKKINYEYSQTRTKYLNPKSGLFNVLKVLCSG